MHSNDMRISAAQICVIGKSCLRQYHTELLSTVSCIMYMGHSMSTDPEKWQSVTHHLGFHETW